MTLNTAHANWKREQQQFTKISTASMPDGFVPGLGAGLAANSASAIA